MSDKTIEYSLESDADYLAKLREMIAAQAIRIRVDPKKLRGMDSPVSVQAETERWAYGMAALGGVVWWFFGIWAAAGAFAACIAAYVIIGRRRIARNIERRIHDNALKDISVWRALWQFGGVTLESMPDGGDQCAAPAGRWISFVERRLAQTGPRGSPDAT